MVMWKIFERISGLILPTPKKVEEVVIDPWRIGGSYVAKFREEYEKIAESLSNQDCQIIVQFFPNGPIVRFFDQNNEVVAKITVKGEMGAPLDAYVYTNLSDDLKKIFKQNLEGLEFPRNIKVYFKELSSDKTIGLPDTMEEIIERMKDSPRMSFDQREIEKLSEQSRKRYRELLRLSEISVRKCKITYRGPANCQC